LFKQAHNVPFNVAGIDCGSISLERLPFRALIGEEEIYMERCFGDEYLAYKPRVNAVFPTLIR